MVNPPAPTEPSQKPQRKVLAATGGAGAGIVTSNLVLWILDDYAFDPSVANSVPGPLEAFVQYVVPLALTFAAGYFVKRAPGER